MRPSPSTVLPMAVDDDSSSTTFQNKEESKTEQKQGDGVIDEPPVDPGTHEELMYALGVNLARQLGDFRPLVETGDELAKIAQGLLDTVVGRLSEEGQSQLLSKRGADLNELVQTRASAIKARLEEAGRDMLENMKQSPGVEVLDSGVVLHVLEHGPEGPGKGIRPTRSSTVKIHYHGTLADGTIFDTTLSGDPVSFPLAGVIPGWREGVLKMHEGETAMLGIPPNLAYGDQGTPDGRIPGGSTLFFKIQLLEVMTAGIGGSPTLLGADGKKLDSKTGTASQSSGLLGADGKPL
ncbi:hypothetical protein ACA910_008531 [Epithemia clementina (nom. ined.)]